MFLLDFKWLSTGICKVIHISGGKEQTIEPTLERVLTPLKYGLKTV